MRSGEIVGVEPRVGAGAGPSTPGCALRPATSGVLVALLPALALAHGAPPQALEIAPRPGSTTDAVVGTTFGALLTRDDGATFRWVCEEGVGLGSNQRARWHYSSSGALFAAAFAGLFVSRDDGCNFAPAPELMGIGASDVEGDADALYVVSSRFGALNGAWKSTDDGRTFTRTPLQSMTEFYSSVRVAPSRRQRLYVGAWYYEPLSAAVIVSDDAGASFTRTDLSAVAPKLGPTLVLAVHPTQPETLLVSVTEDAAMPRSWLLRSTDGAKTFTRVLEAPAQVAQAAFSDDGQLAWAAAGDVLFGSADGAATFSALPAPTRTPCIATAPGARYVCGKPELDGYAIAKGTQAGALQPWLTWPKISGVLDCPATSRTAVDCNAFFPVLQANLGLLDTPDGGAAPNPGPTPRPCGCSSGADLWVLNALTLCAGIFRWRRRGPRVQPIR